MRTWRRIGGSVLVAMLVVQLAPPGPVAAGAAGPAGAAAPGASAPAGHRRTVTLITGDRVTVAGTGTDRFVIARGPGRGKAGFITRRIDGHLHVVPADAAALLRAGRLDARLFDVTALLAYGYDRRDDLPLIVAGGAGAAQPADLSGAGAVVGRELRAIGATAVRLPRAATGSFWRAVTGAGGARLTTRGSKIWLDAVRQPTLDASVARVGAPAAWAAGYTGAGVPVAVLDTGIDPSHPDLAGRIDARQNFTDGPFGEDARDRVGHGTHVASTIAGSGAASGGRYTGVAPGVRLLDGKVCAAAGCAESWILAGMQWAAERGAKVVNMSLSGPDGVGVDPLEHAVDALSARHGTLFVVAAGNSGDVLPVGSPASADAALAVGAVTDTDALADFSARGPRMGDEAIKPEITAPGVDITAARSADGRYGVPGEAYATASGTSMAAPHVAGAAAILAQAHPGWTGARLKAALMASAAPSPDIGVFGQGAGRLDVGRGVGQLVLPEPASLSFGRQAWPHDDDPPIHRTVTYHNHGAAPVTLALAVRAAGPDGRPVPAGTFTVDPMRVTVPAGGTTTVTVTADTRLGGPDGFLGGHLTATGEGVVVQTPVAVHKEVASYDLTLTHTDRDGRPIPSTDTFVHDLDQRASYYLPSESSTHTVRLPKGRYVAWSVQIRGGTDDPEMTMLVQPELRLDRDQTLAFDGRRARPITVTVPRAQSRSLHSELVWSMKKHPDLAYGASVGLPTFDRIFSGPAGSDRPVTGFVSKISSTWGDPVPGGGYDEIPVVFVLAWFSQDRVHTGFQRRVAWDELATIRARHHSHIAGGPAQKNMWSFLPGKHEFSSAVDLMFHLPFGRTEYVNNDGGGVRWLTEMVDDAAFLQPPLVAYRPGRTYPEIWNNAVYAPAFPDRGVAGQWVHRRGDTLSVLVPFFGDGAGHPGFGVVSTARTALFRNGVKLYEEPDLDWREFALPAAGSRYRLELAATRGAPVNAPFDLSTQVSAAWTFRSEHVDGPAPAVLPLAAIRFAPTLDATNAAPAGRAFTLPIAVRRQAGAPGGRIHTPTLEVSYDDGRTWCRVPVRAAGQGWQATLTHPEAGGYVSLRARATDDGGNSVEK
ncbi:MAG TPA: S8 family serine peptidase, partial [Pilimelia sp.]|nr:S8 family serine peptidase [Pilimelia sp.]